MSQPDMASELSLALTVSSMRSRKPTSARILAEGDTHTPCLAGSGCDRDRSSEKDAAMRVSASAAVARE